MKLETTTTSGYKLVSKSYQLAKLGFIAMCGCGILLSGPRASARYYRRRAPRKSISNETVGQVLSHIQREDRGSQIHLKKTEAALPKYRAGYLQQNTPRDLWQVQPPRTEDFYQKGNSDQAQLEKLTDLQIDRLYRLTQEFSRSPARGELWLRLAELYSEKGRMVEFRKQHQFDQKLALYQQKKIRFRPRLDLSEADLYDRKAIQLYQWYIHDFSRSPKVDQALFFLGYNNVQLGNVKQGVGYYKQLTKEFPHSAYISESQFALGEHYFGDGKWHKALAHYLQVVRWRGARLHDFALYKAAWCLYRLGHPHRGLAFLEQVIRHGERGREEA